MIQRYRTRRHPIARAAAWLWMACDRYQWLPLLIVLVLLCIVNNVEAMP